MAFTEFGDYLQYLKFDSVIIDNNVFRLHYKITCMIFLCSSALTLMGDYIGDPIDCMVDGIPSDLMDTYCWIHSTFSVPSRWASKIGSGVPHPGVAPVNEEEIKHHAYYQWVCFFLFLQFMFFHIPRTIWKNSEGGKVKMLIGNLNEPYMDRTDKDVQDQIDTIVKYMHDHRGTHGRYAFRFFLCEVWNFVNVIVQIYFIDFFLGGEFQTYGSDVLNYTGLEAEDRPDPMARVFPKITKCTFHKYGASGTVEKKDGLCVLPQNIINEKIFLFIWIWLVFVAVVTGMFLLYRIATLAGSHLRVALITIHGGKSVKRGDVEAILETTSFSWFNRIGDWFILNLVCKNLNVLVVNDLIKGLHKDLEGNNSNTETLKFMDNKNQTQTSQV